MRDISLESHLALATMRAGHGTSDNMIALLRVLYLAYFIVEPTVAEGDLALFLHAEAALQQSIEAAGQGRAWQVSDDGLELIERLLLRADAIVGSVPKYRYLEAWDRLSCFARSTAPSPLPGSSLTLVWQ
ncbi:hypothetical protein GR157_23910 [Burkholderia sp. 4701]|nr:hypothetical protein [Burkholderia sp. 4701]MXN84962.1 hypothetical protein [Burkholderia sp. 4812]